MMRIRTRAGGGIPPAQLARSTTPRAGVPHPHAVVEVIGGVAVEVEHGAALERHAHVEASRLDASDVAEARHEWPAEIDLTLPERDLEPEDRDRAALFRQLLGRRVSGPRVLALQAVEVVAPERLLVAVPSAAAPRMRRRRRW